ncbi:unnamed protein product [Cuscuta europaea]|uniref:Uncharacterized protein n=1 Tax=Cuscuta europaea TaxID=41803 RepID=A0A9P0ZP53_CUSEU|nr:unnamed protein product [Cuscuta europaea]
MPVNNRSKVFTLLVQQYSSQQIIESHMFNNPALGRDHPRRLTSNGEIGINVFHLQGHRMVLNLSLRANHFVSVGEIARIDLQKGRLENNIA